MASTSLSTVAGSACDLILHVTSMSRASVRSRAWLARGLWNCEEGTLELSGGRMGFATTRGDVRLDVDVAECSISFPVGSARTGSRVQTPSAGLRFWFSNPYLGMGALGGLGSAQAVASEWRQAPEDMG